MIGAFEDEMNSFLIFRRTHNTMCQMRSNTSLTMAHKQVEALKKERIIRQARLLIKFPTDKQILLKYLPLQEK
jgi:hypothetical protein